MLRVEFRRDSLNRLSSVFASGHVEIPETSADEYSLVCAAVSAILQAARLGLEAYVKAPMEVTQRSGELSLRLAAGVRGDERAAAILETARLAVGQIASQYPVHVECREEREP